MNTSFQAVFITAEALTPLQLLSSFTSSLCSSNSSSRTCKLPEINEYQAFHQAHAPWSFQCLKHTIVSKLWQLAGKKPQGLCCVYLCYQPSSAYLAKQALVSMLQLNLREIPQRSEKAKESLSCHLQITNSANKEAFMPLKLGNKPYEPEQW